MATTSTRTLTLVLLLCAVSYCCRAAGAGAVGYTPAKPAKDDFLSCLNRDIPARLLHARSSPSYGSVLASTIRNLKFLSSKTVNPLYIVTPTDVAAGGNVSCYTTGKAWGERYFKGNFDRLARTKAKVDPTDYFRNEQSIPPLIA
ncbi:hypothetical protein ABZP36_021373 [Zizania latifolia]